MKKLNNHRGETLVEVLAAILVASLSVALLFSCVMASSNLDVKAKSVDEDYYQALSAADGQKNPSSFEKITITRKLAPGELLGADALGVDETLNNGQVIKTLNVDIYGGEGLYSYRRTGS